MDLVDFFHRQLSIFADAASLVRIANVDQVMWNQRLSLRRRLGRANIHPAINRHRIERYDFRV